MVSNLFFCVTDLITIEEIYQFSIDWFIELYRFSIQKGPKNKETRTKDIIDTFLLTLFQNVSISLFEKDKSFFSFLMTIKLMQIDKIIDDNFLRYFSMKMADVVCEAPNPYPDWLSQNQFNMIEYFSSKYKEIKNF